MDKWLFSFDTHIPFDKAYNKTHNDGKSLTQLMGQKNNFFKLGRTKFAAAQM